MITNNALKIQKLPFAEIIIAQQLTLLPLYFYIPVWVTTLSIIVAILMFWSKAKTKFVCPRWLKLVITLITIGGIYLLFKKFSGREAGVTLIVAMYSLKILETNKRRDANLILNLSFFILTTGFLFSQQPLIAIYQFIPVIAILYALTKLHQVDISSAFSFASLLKSTSKLLLMALPVMVLLFLFFPRLSSPLWRMPGSAAAVSGVGDSMSPGDVSNLQLFDKIAFRATFNGETPNENDLYWRVLVLDEFDGLTWTRGGSTPFKIPQAQIELLNTIDYSISMEPSRQNYLVTLDKAVSGQNNSTLLSDFVVYSRFRIIDRVKYNLTSAPSLAADINGLTNQQRNFFTRLPQEGNARSKAWAIQERQKHISDYDYLQSLLKTINQDAYYYTLSPPILAQDTVDSFWFDFQRGFCEHYAGAFVYMARAAGIPARVVIGYQGAEKNTLADYWIVRYANAHAWTEVWLEGQGWVRIDPTTAIAPHRVEEQLLSDYSQRNGIFDDFSIVEFDNIGLMKELEYWFDEMNNNWNEWIVDFNSGRQRQLFNNLGIKAISNKQLISLLGIGLALFLLVISFQSFRNRAKQDRLAVAYERFKKITLRQLVVLKQLDNQSLTNLGPKAIYQLILSSDVTYQKEQLSLLKHYIQLRYSGKEASDRQIKKLAKKFSQLCFKLRVANLYPFPFK